MDPLQSQEDILALMRLAKSGNRQAFGEVYRRFYAPVYRYALARVRHAPDAEDVAQTVFVKAMSGIVRFEPGPASPLAYFFTIARNAIIDRSRRKEHVPFAEADDVLQFPDAAPSPAAAAEASRERELLLSAVGALPEESRDVVLWRFLGGLSCAEIGEMLGKSEAAVRQIQCRALKKLRGALDPTSYAP